MQIGCTGTGNPGPLQIGNKTAMQTFLVLCGIYLCCYVQKRLLALALCLEASTQLHKTRELARTRALLPD